MHTQSRAAIEQHAIDSQIREKGSSKSPSTSIFQSILSSQSVTPGDKEESRMAQEGFHIIAAGGESTARILTNATFFLLDNRDTYLPRLKSEIASVVTNPNERMSLKKLEQLPFLVSVHCPSSMRRLANLCRLRRLQW